MTDVSERVRIHDTTMLSRGKYPLKSVDFSWRRGDGQWQRQKREVYIKGNGAVILLYNRAKKSVVLIRQFRMPVFLNGYKQGLVEAAAGMLDGEAPDVRIRAEVEEETGYSVSHVEQVFEAYMSPGAVDEKLTFFIAEYDPESKAGAGGGLADEGEDIEVLEMPFTDAVALMRTGEIVDAKTIMLLLHAQLHVFR